MKLKRELNLPYLLNKKSFFLFGPRGTGKSFLIRNSFGPEVCVINLLQTQVQLRLLQNPSQLEEMIDAHGASTTLVVIDEVQKIPILLDEVHRLIEERGLHFLLTGSSARRLKSSGVNLLAGRAWLADFFPLTFHEIPEFDLDRYLRYGSLPAVWLSDEPQEELDAYVQTYLNEEIKAEGWVRKIPAFAEFLRLAALSIGQVLNFSKFAQDAGVSPPTIASYFQILEDTLLGFQLKPWTKATSRKAIASSKFYLFDSGVTNTLSGLQHLERVSSNYGSLFEQWIATELRAWISYRRNRMTLYFWRTEDQLEVDFIVGEEMAIEVKSSYKVNERDLKTLKIVRDMHVIKRCILVSQDPINRRHEGIEILHWKTFLYQLWHH